MRTEWGEVRIGSIEEEKNRHDEGFRHIDGINRITINSAEENWDGNQIGNNQWCGKNNSRARKITSFDTLQWLNQYNSTSSPFGWVVQTLSERMLCVSGWEKESI
jgi:hypothetical protein